MQIVDADVPILTLERTQVLARVGPQRSGAPVQIVNADDPLLKGWGGTGTTRESFRVQLQIARWARDHIMTIFDHVILGVGIG